MKRRPLIAGNWKMNLDRRGAIDLARRVVEAPIPDHVDVALCPPFVYLEAVAGMCRESRVAWGGQNLFPAESGAYTGEISAAMLVDLGCRYVIVGHSERRELLHETDDDVNRKLKQALAAGLTPIVCVGEKLADRQAGRTLAVVQRQFEESLGGLTAGEITDVVVAYEPIWAIGTGVVATPDQAQEVHGDLRKMLDDRYNASVAQRVRVLYGGSVKADNAAQLLAQPDIDGALVGGASLSAPGFLAIVAAAR